MDKAPFSIVFQVQYTIMARKLGTDTRMFTFFRSILSSMKNSGEDHGDDRTIVIAQLDARVQPIDRGDYFADPLDDVLQSSGSGEVTGGGTQLAGEPDGIAYCDIEIMVNELSKATIQEIISTLEELGAPKGSVLKLPEGRNDIAFGSLEGMALFLNGTDLPAEVYEQSDVNDLISRCEALVEGGGRFRGFWEGSSETALYFYGKSFDDMKLSIEDLLATDPLCAMARVVKIA
ncbi:hypothetical protein [Pseudophaeobacter sp.]|uniref:hypothetical protein n=1 Tax=Pseudophaeobacter sp. TaxID=1971739 RepID=UPI003297F3AE